MKKSVILCIDDEKLVLDSLKTELKGTFGENYTIELTEDPNEALEIFVELLNDGHEIPLVISDYVMPNIKGDELLKRFHGISPNTLKIMLTGQATTEGVTNAVNWARLYRYMAKPWEAEDLTLTVREALKSYFQDKKLEAQNEELRKMNEELEQRVQERTEEISEKNVILEQQRNELDYQHTNITSSIRAAFRIQQALLPSDLALKSHLDQHFVLYKPKDIVSGDFYWIKHIEETLTGKDKKNTPQSKKEGSLVLAAADCTGHGVPGAFMSLLGIALLHEIVSKYSTEIANDSILSAGEILNRLRDKIIEALHQSNRNVEIHEGMDIALCVLDMTSNTMQYAGANNSLYIVKDTAIPDKKYLFELKPDKMPIGLHSEIHPFTNHSLQLTHGDIFYIFSDGYADQFGGADFRKFLVKNFKDYLVSIAGESMIKQKELLTRTLDDWRGDTPQVDDIMVIGVKV